MTNTTTTTTTLGTDDRHEGNNNAERERCRVRALRKSAIADATRQTLPRACRSILAPQVDFSRNHTVPPTSSTDFPPRSLRGPRKIRGVTPVFLRPSVLPPPVSPRCKFFKLGNSRNYLSHSLHCFSSNIFVILDRLYFILRKVISQNLLLL